MPLPSSNYQAMFPLQEVILGKDDGLPLAGGIVTFYADSPRTTPPTKKFVYQQVQLPDNTYEFVVLNNPITLSAIGSFMDDNGNDIIPFLYPYAGLPTDPVRGAIELYYITVQDSNGVAQFTREAWPPNMSTSTNMPVAFQSPTNELSNPQFSVVNFTPLTGYTFNVTGSQSTEIAPDWVVDTTGTGTVTVAQIVMPDKTPSNPPFALQISSTAVTTIQLRQRLTVSSRLLAGGYVSGTFIAKSVSAPVQLALSYRPSTSTTSTLVVAIASGTATTAGFTTIANSQAATINISNFNSAPGGFIDIFFDIPSGASVEISSVQIVAVQNSESSTQYMQQSNAREIDHLYHYYNLPLQAKPISSYLVGWDFPVNPAQFGASILPQNTGPNKSYYAWDQTIVFQSATSGITVTRDAEVGMMQLNASVNNVQAALIQYLDQAEAKAVLTQLALGGVSVNVAMEENTPQTMTVSLWWKAGAIGTGMTANDSLVTALDANGHPSVTAGWTEIKLASNLGNATFKTVGTTSITNYGFSGFVDPLAYVTGTSFAIVVGSSPILLANAIVFRSISLVPGLIPTIPAPEDTDAVLRKCQKYFETSYPSGGVNNAIPPVGSINAAGARSATMLSLVLSGNASACAGPFGVEYRTIKRANPSVVFYNITTGGSNAVQVYLRNFQLSVQQTVVFSTFFVLLSASALGVSYQGLASIMLQGGSANFAGANILYQFSADARLGVIA